MEDRIDAALRNLRTSIEKIRSLQEWHRLKNSEKKPGTPPSFEIYESIDGEIKAEEGFFLNLAESVRAALNDRSDDKSARQKKRLMIIEKQFRQLTAEKPL